MKKNGRKKKLRCVVCEGKEMGKENGRSRVKRMKKER